MADAVPVLLPVRLETRFDDGVEGFLGTRLRVLVVPDVCWYDRRGPATDAELDLLDAAVGAAGGALLGTPGAAASPAAASAFDDLAGAVGPGRAMWLARTFPAADDGTGWRVDRGAGPHRTAGPTSETRISGLPPALELHAQVGTTMVKLGDAAPIAELVVSQTADGWWPSWAAMETAGLTFTVDLDTIQPVEINVLFVTGLGVTDADDLISGHVDTGSLGLLRPGAPTNTVSGTPAADLGQEPAAWRALAERSADGAESRLAAAMLTDPKRMGPLVGDRAREGLREPLVMALWPALAGHSLREVWALGPASVADAQRWAISHLEPEGPLPPVRIGVQPYGVWPVSAWERWDAADTGGPLEAMENELVPRALAAVTQMAARAETGLGTVVGADEDRLWDLLAQTPTSDTYDLRLCEPIEMLRAPVDVADRPRFDDWWDRIADRAKQVALARPDDGMVALGAPMALPRLGLVLPPIAFGPKGEPLFLPHIDFDPGEAEALLTKEPARWLVVALRWLADDLFREASLGQADALLRPVWFPASLLWRLLLASGSVALDHALREDAGAPGPLLSGAPPLRDRIAGGSLVGGNGPANRAYELFRKGVSVLADEAEQIAPEDGMAFVAELERVLRGLLDTAGRRADPWLTGAANRRLGELRGSPRPLGLYSWVDRPFTGDPGPDKDVGLLLAPSDAQARAAVVLRDKAIDDTDGRWHMDLTSRTIRDAVRLGDEVRAGAHPSEALGREVERLVGERGQIDILRARFPVRTEHEGRRTCDGLQVLDAVLRAPAGAPPVDAGLIEAGLDGDVIERIRILATTIDAHADLLVADAVHHAIAGRAEAAAKALEAAAGLGSPPELDVVATPSRGRSVRTTVLTALPAASPAEPGSSPVALASPALAAWLAQVAGHPAGPSWTWTARKPGGDASVTLADLGLTPADAVAVDAASLVELVAARTAVDASLVDGPAGPANVRALTAVFGERPLEGADLGLAPAEASAFDDVVRLEMEARITRLVQEATALAERLETPADDNDRDAALVQAARWSPGGPPDDDPVNRATAAAVVLRARVAAAPVVPGSAEVAVLAAAIVALAAPRVALPVLATAAAPLPGIGALTAEPEAAGGRPALDQTWLELAAAVRPPLARLEAHQAHAAWTGRTPFVAATNSPDDPWAEAAAALPLTDPAVPNVVIVYSPQPLPAGGPVAWTVLDRYAEVIPASTHGAAGAFRFNAPAAQAPQAILLAVPSRSGERVDGDAILATVRRTREVAHARMARAEDVDHLDVLIPVLPGLEDGGFHYRAPADRTG